jgi:adenylate cyclase
MRRSLVIGLPLGAAIGAYYALWTPLRQDTSRLVTVVGNIVIAIVFGLVFLLQRRRLFDRVERELVWVLEGRPPTEDERHALLELPQRLAIAFLRVMFVVAIVVTLLNFGSGRVVGDALQVLVGLGLTAFVLSALAYLIVEDTLRPIFALGLPGWRADQAPAVGVKVRLVLAWALGSGIPLLFILAIPLRGNGRVLPTTVPMLFMATLGIVVGGITTLLVARSVAEPLATMRSGLDRVRKGDLDVEVPVDNGGELGWVQAGFNDMVVGLRERRRLQTLFGGYVGEDVARHALSEGVRLGGELRTATALFVDLVDSTGMAHRRPPEEVVSLLNDFFAAVIEVVSAEGGWVNKFQGDAALCVFGAPARNPDHAASGLRAARTLQSRLQSLTGKWPTLDVGIAVSSGQVVAGNVGNETRHEYTIIGDAVNEAARLTDWAKQRPERVVASGSTVSASGNESEHWQQVDRAVVRGRESETILYTPISTVITRS